MIRVKRISTPICIFANMEKFNELYNNQQKIDEAIKSIHKGFAYRSGELGYRVLTRDDNSNVLVIVLPEGSEFESTQIDRSVILQVLDGRIRFKNKYRDVELSAGHDLTVTEKGYYIIDCQQESTIVLTTSIENVETVAKWHSNPYGENVDFRNLQGSNN